MKMKPLLVISNCVPLIYMLVGLSCFALNTSAFIGIPQLDHTTEGSTTEITAENITSQVVTTVTIDQSSLDVTTPATVLVSSETTSGTAKPETAVTDASTSYVKTTSLTDATTTTDRHVVSIKVINNNSTTTPIVATTIETSSTKTTNSTPLSNSNSSPTPDSQTDALKMESTTLEAITITKTSDNSVGTQGKQNVQTELTTKTISTDTTMTSQAPVMTSESPAISNINNISEVSTRPVVGRMTGQQDEEGDTYWPVATALTIAIPAVIVFSVTITVLYRRRVAKPRNSLAMYGQDYENM